MAKKGTFPANAMRRGEIYWVDIPNAIGHELMKDRPAIIMKQNCGSCACRRHSPTAARASGA